MPNAKPIQTIADQVYSILKKNICEGQYPPGFWLQENELCEQLGVSRSPVREALRRLVSDGLVISIPNKGTFVKEFTCKDIDEIFDMRVMLEGYAIRNSRANLTSAHIQQLLDLTGWKPPSGRATLKSTPAQTSSCTTRSSRSETTASSARPITALAR